MNRFLNDKKNMELKQAIKLLKDHNIWRRYDGEISESPTMTDPKKLGISIDKVVNEFENLFISSVSQQRELLISYENYTSQQIIGKENNRIAKSLVDGFLANNFTNKKMTNKERFMQLVSKEKTNTIKINKRRIKYRFFIRIKNRIILYWLNLKDIFNCL